MDGYKMNREQALEIIRRYGTGRSFKNKLSGTIRHEIFNPEFGVYQMIYLPKSGNCWIKFGTDLRDQSKFKYRV